MKTITLHRLTLTNFQGGTCTLEPAGDDLNVFAANAGGKTRLASAFSWLLFNKDSLGRADFTIKNLDAQGEAEHGLDHSCEAVLSVDGIPTTLKKVYREVWSKKRGAAKDTLTGNTVDHFLDGVPVQQKEYVARVAELAGDESVFRLLSSPTAFPSLHWQKQRTLLLEVCGDQTDAQVIESDESLALLTDLLKKYALSKAPFEDLKKVIASRRSEINKRLEQLPVRIDEVRRGLPDVTGLNREGLTVDIEYQEKMIADAKVRLSGIDNGGRIAEVSKKIEGVNADLTGIQNGHFAINTGKANKLSARINEITTAKQIADRQAQSIKNELATKQERIDVIDKRLEGLRARWHEIDARKFEGAVEDRCSACGQALPHDQVEAARENAVAEFNRKKAQDLTDIETDGKGYVNEKNRLVGEIKKLTEATTEAVDDSELEALTSERDSLKKIADDYSLIPGREDLLSTKALLEAELRTARESVSVDREATQKGIDEREAQLKETKEKADRFGKREASEKRIEDLKKEEKTLAAEFEELERQLFLCESFTKRKVSLLTDRINGRFEFVRFRLFNQLVNGGIEDCCEIMVNGVGYNSGLNNAARIQGGLDIIRTLQEHYGLKVPVMIDNRESVTEIPAMDCQVVSLIVSPNDKVLRAEAAGKQNSDALFGSRAA